MAVRRSSGFAVRRWLQLGAASAGMGAALWGLSLAGPTAGTAVAEAGGTSSAASSAPSSASGSDGSKPARSARPVRRSVEPRRAGRPADRSDDDVKKRPGQQRAERDYPAPAATPMTADALAAQHVPTVAAPPDRPAPSLTRSWQSPQQRWVSRSLDAWTDDSLSWIAGLQTSDRTKAQLEASFFTIRRTFFNQAPTIEPVQITGVLDGPVTGTVGAYDPDGDRLVYVLTRGPSSGSVHIDRDGTFVYTPGDDFDGVDAFRVTAIDIGFHTNLLEPFRPIGSNPVRSLINQGAVKFDFHYTVGAEHWTDERRDALQRAADALIVYFRVKNPVSLAFDVEGEDDRGPSASLASAGSDRVSGDPGFWSTVVQQKLLTGRDANAGDADGEITWNFAYAWGLGDTVGTADYDFHSTAMHELLHSFGFLSGIGPAGSNAGRSWAALDRYMVTASGDRPIGRNYRWDEDFDGHLTGGHLTGDHLTGDDGGLYFSGRNAVAAYGRYVPMYYPAEWDPGSSAHHTDDSTFAGAEQLLMNARTATGLGVRVVSAIEVGILRDLGYTMVALSR